MVLNFASSMNGSFEGEIWPRSKKLVKICLKFFMERFLQLQFDQSSPIPPISQLVACIVNDPNDAFFKAANFLHSGQSLNAIYTLVSIRELISLSPLEYKDNDEQYIQSLLPSNSYKWLYLLYSLSSRKLCDDKELEMAKNEYVFQKIHDFLVNASYDIPGAAQFAVGVLCFAAKLMDFVSASLPCFTTDVLFNTLYKLLKSDSFPSPVVVLSDFSQPELFSFFCPYSMDYIPSTNLYQDLTNLIHASVIRLLYRIFPFAFPSNVDDFKSIIQPLCVSGQIVEISFSVLTLLFNGDRDAATSYNDMIQYKSLVEDINQHYKETNEFQNSIQYQSAVKLSQSLRRIIQIAEKNPSKWVDFLENHQEVIEQIDKIVRSEYDTNLVIASAALLRLGHVKFNDLSYALNLLISSSSKQLRQELSQLLLSQPEKVVPYVIKCFPAVCNYGSRSSIFFDFLRQLTDLVNDPKPILQALMESLKTEFKAIQLHPNSHIYTQLANYIEVQGSYLDSQPCGVCNNPELIPSSHHLEEVCKERKYTHDTIFALFKNPLLISTFSLSFNIKKRKRTPRTVKIFVSSEELTQSFDLVGNRPNWMHISDLQFPRGATKATVTFPLQLFATSLKLQFTEFWEDTSGDVVLRCPQCHNEIPDYRSGICQRCHENAYTCRECRNINYNHLDGFICCECGSSSYISMDWSLTSVPSFSNTCVKSAEDVEKSLDKCDHLMKDAHEIFSSVTILRNQIEQTLSPATNMTITDRISKLKSMYGEKCKAEMKKLTNIVQHVAAIRSAVGSFLNLIDNTKQVSITTMCFNCRATYIKNGLNFLAKASEMQAIESLNAPSLLISFIDSVSFTADAVNSLLIFCSIRPDLTNRVVELFKQSLPNPSVHMVKLLCNITTLDDNYKKDRFMAISDAAIISTEFMTSNGSITPTVVQPLFSALLSSSLIIRQPELEQKLRIFDQWRKESKVNGASNLVDPLDLIPFETMKKLLVECTSENVRRLISELLIDTAKLSRDHSDRILSFILDLLSSIESFSSSDTQILDVLNFLLEDPKRQLHALLGNNLFDRIITLLENEVSHALKTEHTLLLDLSIGCVPYMLTTLLTKFFFNDVIARYILLRKKDQFTKIIRIHFQVKSLVIQRSKYLDDMISLIQKHIISRLFNDFQIDDDLVYPNTIGKELFLMTAIDSINNSPRSVMSKLSNILVPKHAELNVPIITKKMRGQEDYMPGQMPKEPFMSKTVGTIMRDVKRKVCIDLRMESLIEDEHGMELLVDNKIISLDLKIEEVYKNVWKPINSAQPMIVVCRIQGVDGEAVEPLITSFPKEASEKEIPLEEKYAYTAILSKNNSLQPFLEALKKDSTPLFVQDCLTALNCFSVIDENRSEMCKLGFVDVIFDTLESLVKQETNKVKLLEDLIHFCTMLLKENSQSDSNPDKHIDFIFNAIDSPIVIQNQSLLNQLLSLVPLIALNSHELMEKVSVFFLVKLTPKAKEDNVPFNIYETPTALQILNCFGEFLLTIPSSEQGNEIRDVIFKQPFLTDAISYLQKLFPISEGRKSQTWEENVDIETLPALLKTLAGMVCTHAPTQQLFLDQALFQLLLELSLMVSNNSIGELASSVIAQATIEPSICLAAINAIKENKNRANKAMADKVRNEVLKKTQPALSPELTKMLDEIDNNENNWQCCICKEGYDYSPDEPLGFYVFESYNDNCYVTTTHFTCVHNSCHNKERSKGDREKYGKKILSEWDAAVVRNCERRCNAIFPVPSDTLSIDDYKRLLVVFYTNDNRISDYTINLVNDVNYHLNKLSEGTTIAFSMGGGSMPNQVAIFPFLVYAGIFFMDDLSGSNTITQDHLPSKPMNPPQPAEKSFKSSHKSTSTFSSMKQFSFGFGGPTRNARSTNRNTLEKRMENILNGQEKSLNDALALSLWVLTLEEWNKAKLILLKLYLKKLDNSLTDDEIIQKSLVMLKQFIIIDRMQRMMKTPSGIEPQFTETQITIPSHENQKWIKDFMIEVASNGFAMSNEWKEFGEEVEDEIIQINDLKTAFIYLELKKVVEEAESPIAWIKTQV